MEQPKIRLSESRSFYFGRRLRKRWIDHVRNRFREGFAVKFIEPQDRDRLVDRVIMR